MKKSWNLFAHNIRKKKQKEIERERERERERGRNLATKSLSELW